MIIPELEILKSLIKSIDNMARLPEGLWDDDIMCVYKTLCKEVLVYQQICRDVISPTQVHSIKEK